MKIRFECPDCKRVLAVRRRHAGAKVKCPSCGRVAVVPEAVEAASTAETSRASPPSVPTADSEVPPVRFAGKRELDDEVDMTPMVDVTFLLLIFFMVTAAFSLQRSIEVPPPEQQEDVAQTRTLEELEQDDDYVIVRIDSDDTVFVDESPAPSEHELLRRLREAREGVPGSGSSGSSSLLVLAHGDCRHETVVSALDAGNAVGMENVRLATADETDF